MPIFYMLLVSICAGVTFADMLYYEYEFWYVQGTAMLLITGIVALVFGCGRVRFSKFEK